MEDPSECPEVVPEEASEKINRKKLRKNLEDKNKNPYLCTTFRKKLIEKSSLRNLHIQQ